MISSNLGEVLRASDRVVVLFEGRVAGEMAADNADMDTIGAWMVDGDRQPDATLEVAV